MKHEIHSIWVKGTPIPQGSKTARVINGRPIMYEANRKHAEWRKNIVQAVEYYFRFNGLVTVPPIPVWSPIEVYLEFYFNQAKTNTKTHMTQKPDIDKLCRTILDGVVESGLIPDDSQVIKLTAIKAWTDPVKFDTEGCYIDIKWED